MKTRSSIFLVRITLGSLLLSSLAGCWVRSNVPVSHMVKQAKFETYIFSADPSWTMQPQIINLRFFGEHTFIIAYRAVDGQSTYLFMDLGKVAEQTEELLKSLR